MPRFVCVLVPEQRDHSLIPVLDFVLLELHQQCAEFWKNVISLQFFYLFKVVLLDKGLHRRDGPIQLAGAEERGEEAEGEGHAAPERKQTRAVGRRHKLEHDVEVLLLCFHVMLSKLRHPSTFDVETQRLSYSRCSQRALINLPIALRPESEAARLFLNVRSEEVILKKGERETETCTAPNSPAQQRSLLQSLSTVKATPKANEVDIVQVLERCANTASVLTSVIRPKVQPNQSRKHRDKSRRTGCHGMKRICFDRQCTR
mmetsp:Transcript_15599/g.31438  ORF Transcript_15599/g.31438 Transcript_15599/m.31438 type:complete len:260 (-) Transcript_15599:76-855(-)